MLFAKLEKVHHMLYSLHLTFFNSEIGVQLTEIVPKNVVKAVVDSKTKSIYFNGLSVMFTRYHKCISLERDRIEKQ